MTHFFKLRCLFDLQLKTIVDYLEPQLVKLKGSVLDVGAGQMPWRTFVQASVNYIGVDIESAEAFGMYRSSEIIYYDGKKLPMHSESFDYALCIEVLEHVPDPLDFLLEIKRVLRPEGTLFMTIPFSARRHHIPYDFQRFTREGLALIMNTAGFYNITIVERGNDIAVITNKLIVLIYRLIKMRSIWRIILCWPLLLFCAPIAAIFLCAAHLSFRFHFGSLDDPLGYAVRAQRK